MKASCRLFEEDVGRGTRDDVGPECHLNVFFGAAVLLVSSLSLHLPVDPHSLWPRPTRKPRRRSLARPSPRRWPRLRRRHLRPLFPQKSLRRRRRSPRLSLSPPLLLLHRYVLPSFSYPISHAHSSHVQKEKRTKKAAPPPPPKPADSSSAESSEDDSDDEKPVPATIAKASNGTVRALYLFTRVVLLISRLHRRSPLPHLLLRPRAQTMTLRRRSLRPLRSRPLPQKRLSRMARTHLPRTRHLLSRR